MYIVHIYYLKLKIPHIIITHIQ